MSPMAIAGIVILAIIAIAALIAIPILLGSFFPVTQVIGSGSLQTQEVNITDFTTIDASYGFKVNIIQSNSYKVTITTDSNILDLVQTSKSDNTLHISLKPGYSIQTFLLKAEISMPNIQALHFSGGTNGTAENIASSNDLQIELSGGSICRMSGTANNLSVTASGGSNFDLNELVVHNAQIELSGGSQGTINLNGTLNADLSGGSRLFYRGSPILENINTSGGSSIAQK